MNISIATNSYGDYEAHKTGCQHLRTKLHDAWQFDDFETRLDVAVSLYADQIDEGSMDEEDALGYLHFGPCVTLPERGVAL